MPAEEIGSAYIRIRADTRAFAEEAKHGVQSAVRGDSEAARVPVRATVNRGQAEATIKRDLGGAVKSSLGYIGGIFAATKVFEFGKSTIEEAATVQKMQESIRQEYGKSGDKLKAFAEGSASSLGISTAASETASARFGALFKNLGFAPEASSKMSLGLQKVVGSLAQIRDVDPTPVLDKLNTTLATGSTRGLRSLGVALDSTTIKTYALSHGIVTATKDSGQIAAAQEKQKLAQENLIQVQAKYGRGSDQFHQAAIANTLAHEGLRKAIAGTVPVMTVAQKDQAVYGLVTKNLSQNMKDAKQHSGDYANQSKVLTAEFKNAEAAIGEGLLPVATEFLHVILASVTFITKYKTEFVGLASAVAVGVTAWAAYLAISKAVAIAQGIAELSSLALGSSYVVLTEEQALAGESATGLSVALDSVGLSSQVLATGGIALVVFGLYELYEHSATAKRIMNEVAHFIKAELGVAFNWLGKTVLPAVEHAFTSFIGFVQHAWKRWGADIIAVVKFAFNFFKGIIQADLNIVKAYINLFGDIIHGRWGKIWGDVKNIVRAAWGLIRAEFGKAADFIRHFFTTTIPRFLSNAADSIFRAAKHLGERIIHGIINGVTSLAGDIKSTLEDKIKSGLSSLNPFSPIEHGAKVYIADPITKGTTDALRANGSGLQDQMVQYMTVAIRVALNHMQTFAHNQADDIGTAIVQGVHLGVSPLGRNLGNQIVDAAHAAIAHAQSALGIHSPSTLFAEQIGKPMMEGVLHGMGGLEKALQSKIVSAAQAAAAASGGGGGSSPTGTAATGANQRLGYQMMLQHGIPANQWGALQALWMQESGWNQFAKNPTSGAFGIPQELGHNVSAAYLAGDVAAQIAWGLGYIRAVYHNSPAEAWAHEQKYNWYGGGGVVPGPAGAPQAAIVHGGEVVFTPEQMGMLSRRPSISIGQVVLQSGDAQGLLSELDEIARSIG